MIEYRDTAYGRVPLPAGIRSRIGANGNGLRMHFLEADFEEPSRPCALLLHGFPELALFRKPAWTFPEGRRSINRS